MGPPTIVTGLSSKEDPPGTRVTIRGKFLGTGPADLQGLTICSCDCLFSAECKSSNKIIARSGPAKGHGGIIVTTRYGRRGTSTVQFWGVITGCLIYVPGVFLKSCNCVVDEMKIHICWFRCVFACLGYYETTRAMKESALWVEEAPWQTLAWGRRSISPTNYQHEDPFGLSVEENEYAFNVVI
jgi:exocyst complex component 2